MASRKTKRVAVVTALSASLVIGGAAAFASQSDAPACPRGHGKGLGIGAPGNGKGQGAEHGWPHKCEDHGQSGDDHGQSGEDHGNSGDHGQSGDDHGHDGSGDQGGTNSGGSDSTGGGTTGGDNGTVGTSDNGGNVIDVQASVEVDLPDPTALAQDAAQGALGILTPAAESVVGQAVQAAGQAQDLAQGDVAGITNLLESAAAGAMSLQPASGDAGINVSGGNVSGSVALTGTTDGVTSLAGQLVSGTLNIVGGTRTGLFGIVSGMTLPL